MDTDTNLKWGLALSAFLALTDIAGLAGAGVDDAPPWPVIAFSALLGVVTFAALRPALRRSPAALWTVIVTRTLSALAGLPPFFVDAPTYVRVACAVALVLAVLAVGLLAPYVRGARSSVRPA